MSYKDSFVYSLRQKVGDMRLITAGIDVVPINKDGQVKLVYLKDRDDWFVPGGNAELGESWQSATLRELYEEAGIVADFSDLELFATFSGPGYINQYKDGSTQCFAVLFLCRKWREERKEVLDMDEVKMTRWYSFEEARREGINRRTLMILDACERYLETGKVQTIIEE